MTYLLEPWCSLLSMKSFVWSATSLSRPCPIFFSVHFLDVPFRSVWITADVLLFLVSFVSLEESSIFLGTTISGGTVGRGSFLVIFHGFTRHFFCAFFSFLASNCHVFYV